jgi:DNA-binding CsgD family transcriptional regulator
MPYGITPVDGVEVALSFRDPSRADHDRRSAARVLTSAIRSVCGNRPLSQAEETLLCLSLLGWDESDICEAKGLAASTIRCTWQRIFEKAGVDSRRAIVGDVIVKAVRSVRPIAFEGDRSEANLTPGEGIQIQISVRNPEVDDRERRRAARVLANAIRNLFQTRPLSQLEETILVFSLLGRDDADICRSNGHRASTIRSVWQRIREKGGAESKRVIVGEVVVKALGVRRPAEESSHETILRNRSRTSF